MLIIGCGNMGGAILRRWMETDSLPPSVTLVKPSAPDDDIINHPAITWHASPDALPVNAQFDTIMLAVKPYQMAEIITRYRAYANDATCWITIAAGVPLARYREWVNGPAPVLRAMPNTPVQYGEGVTSLIADGAMTDTCMQQMHMLWSALGTAIWLDDESQMDAATAIAGSGPAYAYLFMDALTQAGIANGLPPAIARAMATQMLKGSAITAHLRDDTPLATLRQHVTSKGGTTAAALEVFMQHDALKTLTHHAVSAAIARAKAMASE